MSTILTNSSSSKQKPRLVTTSRVAFLCQTWSASTVAVIWTTNSSGSPSAPRLRALSPIRAHSTRLLSKVGAPLISSSRSSTRGPPPSRALVGDGLCTTTERTHFLSERQTTKTWLPTWTPILCLFLTWTSGSTHTISTTRTLVPNTSPKWWRLWIGRGLKSASSLLKPRLLPSKPPPWSDLVPTQPVRIKISDIYARDRRKRSSAGGLFRNARYWKWNNSISGLTAK